MGGSETILLIFVALLWLEPSHGQCTLCTTGDPITLPEAPVNLLEPIPIATCGDLNGLMGFIQEGSSDCAGIQTLGGLCGCPVPEGACQLCPGSALKDPLREITGSAEIAQQAPAGLAVNCQFVDSYVQSLYSEGTGECSAYQDNYGNQCECQEDQQGDDGESDQDQGPNIIDDKPDGDDDGDAPSEDPIDLSNATVAENPCTLCPNGEQTIDRDKTIDIPGVPFDTCGQVAEVAQFLEEDATECMEGVNLLSSFCGCEKVSNTCQLCDGQEVPLPDKILKWFTGGLLDNYGISEESQQVFLAEGMSCGLMDTFLISSVEDGSEACFANQLRRDYCGCDTHPKYKTIVWVARVSGFLSLVSSISIIQSILRDAKLRGLFYHQLVLAISCFDILSSLVYVMRPLFLPTSDVTYQAHGNDLTCTAQGFALQLGYGSVFFNLVLAIYFYLIIARRWREDDFRRVRHLVFGTALFVGISLACGGIPFYEANLFICYIHAPPFTTSWIPITFFFFIPICSAIIGITIFTFLLYRFVFATNHAASKWRLATAAGKKKVRNKMQEQVFWRCFWYLLAFYLPWPILLVANFVELNESNYPFWVALAIFAPSQGFLNSLVYYQRSSGATRTWVQYLRNMFACCFGGIDQHTVHKEELWSPDSEKVQNNESSTHPTARRLPSGGTAPSGTSQGTDTTAAGPTQSFSTNAMGDARDSWANELILNKIEEHEDEAPKEPGRRFSLQQVRTIWHSAEWNSNRKVTRRLSVDSGVSHAQQQPTAVVAVGHMDPSHLDTDFTITSVNCQDDIYPEPVEANAQHAETNNVIFDPTADVEDPERNDGAFDPTAENDPTAEVEDPEQGNPAFDPTAEMEDPEECVATDEPTADINDK